MLILMVVSYEPDAGDVRNTVNAATGNGIRYGGHRIVFHPTGTAGTTDRGDGGHCLYVVNGESTGTNSKVSSRTYKTTYR